MPGESCYISALLWWRPSMQFCDQTLGRAQGLVGFHAQGLTGFHTQKLVWFMLRNFWILFSEVSGILWPNHGASSSTGRSSIPWPLSWVQVRVFSPLGPGLRSSQGQPVLSLAHFAPVSILLILSYLLHGNDSWYLFLSPTSKAKTAIPPPGDTEHEQDLGFCRGMWSTKSS